MRADGGPASSGDGYNHRKEKIVAADPDGITELLQLWRTGDREAETRLFELLMADLRSIAARCFRSERPDHTLQPTALVNEAFFRLARAKNIDWQDRGHFFAIASIVMRRLLIDYARGRPAIQLVAIEGLPESVLVDATPLEQAIAIDALLDELGREAPQQRRVVELKFSLGMTDEEAAEALNLKLRSFQREWHRARKWLFQRLTGAS
jgi:RNA polymerase sigma factor (TIGR02999 family)